MSHNPPVTRSSLVQITSPATPRLTYQRLMFLFDQCGDMAADTYIRTTPLNPNEKGCVYFLVNIYTTSRRTVEVYARNLCRFINFTLDSGIQNFAHVTPEDLSNYVGYLRSRKLKESSIATYMATIYSFYSMLLEHSQLDEKPTKVFRFRMKQEANKIAKRTKGLLTGHVTKTLSEGEIDNLMERAQRELPIRDAALLSFMYLTGARSAEICNLKWKDIYNTGETGWFVRLLGKGHKEREVYLPKDLIDTLMALRRKEYLVRPYSPALGIDAFPVFSNAYERGEPLHYKGLYNIIKRASQALGLPKDISPHWLRHTHATHLRRKGATLEQIQTSLGHSHITTTQRYIHQNARENPAGKCFEDTKKQGTANA